VDFFGEEKRIGKTLGTDLASGKLTLPLLVLLERLPAAEAAALVSEVSGERPPQLALRLKQMNELGVFEAVAQAVNEEVEAATAALRAWSAEAPTPLLLGLGDVLREQVQSLQARR
jgi:octaprenyl-diphosphate synthase